MTDNNEHTLSPALCESIQSIEHLSHELDLQKQRTRRWREHAEFQRRQIAAQLKKLAQLEARLKGISVAMDASAGEEVCR